jgi:hypothetical protein
MQFAPATPVSLVGWMRELQPFQRLFFAFWEAAEAAETARPSYVTGLKPGG